MPTATPSAAEWFSTLRELIHYYLPPIPPSPETMLGALLALLVGLALAFRGAKLAQLLVTTVGLAAGAGVGYALAQRAGTPAAISAAVGAVLVGYLAHRSHRWWLGVGTVLTLILLSFGWQLFRQADLADWLNGAATGERSAAAITLPSPDEQLQNLYPEYRDRVARLGRKIGDTVRGWGPSGWLIPAAGLVLGVVLALRALRIVAVVWVGMLGASLAVCGAAGLLAALSPALQERMSQRPDVLVWSAAGTCVLGLVYQIRDARFGGPRRTADAKPANVS